MNQKRRIVDKRFKVHLDGYNLLPYLTGQEQQGPRREFFYFSDDGLLTGLQGLERLPTEQLNQCFFHALIVL